MKIAMMADTYKPHVSGVTNYISLNKQFLEKAGHEVYIFTFGDEDFPDDETRVIRSPGLPLIDTGFYLGLRYSRRARQLLYTMDIAHVHHPFLSGSLALRYCMPHNIPIIFTNHSRYDLLTQAYLPILPEAIGDAALKAYLQPFCRAVDLVIAPSQGMAEVLQRLEVDTPIEVIPNGVDLTPFNKKPHPSERASVGFTASDIILINVGRIAPEKNLNFLLRAFYGISETYPNVRLLFVGDGPERENLASQVHHMALDAKVHFTGMIPYEEIAGYLAISDAFITASVTEVFPLSLIEASASGIPLLGIDSPGVSDIIQDGVTGFIVKENDLAVYTAKLARLVTEHDLRRKMGLAAAKASQAFDIQRTTQLVLGHYLALVNAAHRRKVSWRSRLTRYLDQIR